MLSSTLFCCSPNLPTEPDPVFQTKQKVTQSAHYSVKGACFPCAQATASIESVGTKWFPRSFLQGGFWLRCRLVFKTGGDHVLGGYALASGRAVWGSVGAVWGRGGRGWTAYPDFSPYPDLLPSLQSTTSQVEPPSAPYKEEHAPRTLSVLISPPSPGDTTPPHLVLRTLHIVCCRVSAGLLFAPPKGGTLPAGSCLV